jgi:integrase
MASIHKKLRSPFWYCEFRSADGRWLKRSTKLRNRRQAFEWCQSLQHAQDLISAGSPPEAQLRTIITETMTKLGKGMTTPTARSWFDAWISARKGTAKPTTLAKYRGAVTSFLTFLGPRADSRLETITQPDIVAFRDALMAQGKTAATCNQVVLRIIGGGFSLAFRQGVIRHNPLAGMRPLRDPTRKRKRAFTIDEVRKLLAVVKEDWRGAVLCGYSSGMRLSDVTGLRWNDIDLERGLISFEQVKTGAATVVGLHEDFREWLLQQPQAPGAYIFPQLAEKPTAGRYGLSNQFSEIMSAAGIESELIREKSGKGHNVRALSFHSFRHGAASAIFKAKVVEESVKRITGHGQGQSHKHYLHVDVDAVKAAASLIPRL